MGELNNKSLTEILEEAWAIGQSINLEDIGYGRIHWGNKRDIKNTPGSHYYLLAGLVRFFSFRRICEIGTHCGGSTRAMYQGFEGDEDTLIVTLDVTKESDKYLKDFKGIEKIRGDANQRKQIEQVVEFFGGQPIDFLFIDADHKFVPTLFNYTIYSTLLRPKLVCLDDITLNPEMQQVWSYVQMSVPAGDAVNVAEIIPEVRPGKPGFGCVLMRDRFD
ncbi:class I SAM-dependent methyltransferase [Nitrosococcus wardiae]|uniref:Class I SAM-dependent methyltransferase n=1 Tax=Nitrosococcus wardiae TaxID=1814290 RepID=A0A4P7BX10_9GAMM|nr:class I SAM-dependent methyltransferase [Nitrosococcus wardiae]QBQ54511.1 class I SAM-dependent methyltransferase [Nitrosococcus wardiae]